MGWNHWYAHYDRVTDKLMREAADVMVSSGMADVGYQYVNIDDCWMNAPRRRRDPLRVGPLPRRTAATSLPNKHFPDMKALTDYIHAKGLKAGHLHLARAAAPAPASPAPTSTRRRTPSSSPIGASTS